jgi:stage V sporulation protein B
VQNSERNMLLQGTILASAGIVTKIIGFLYRIPMANLLGNAGNGIYSVAFGIYNIALTLSSSSLPLAVSKTVSARAAADDERGARRVFFDALALALVLGSLSAAALWLGADGLEALYHRPAWPGRCGFWRPPPSWWRCWAPSGAGSRPTATWCPRP